MSDSSYSLVFAFTDESESFAHGVEIGMILRDIEREGVGPLDITVHTANKDVIVRMCAAYSWMAEFQATEFPEWTHATLTRAKYPRLAVVL